MGAAILTLAMGTCLASAGEAQTMETPATANQLVQTRTVLRVAARPAPARNGAHAETVFTAHVTDAAGQALDGESGAGSVSFEMGPVLGAAGAAASSLSSTGASLGSAVVDEHGDAALTVTTLPVGADGSATTVHAIYHPAADNAESSSVSGAAMIEADATGVPDFSITANPSTITATQGQFASTTLTITPINGFNEQVTLSCSALPAQVTCTFSPVIDSTAKGAFTSTLQVQTQTSNKAAMAPGGSARVAFAWMLPGVLALAGFAGLQRKALVGSVKGAGLLVVLLAVGGLAGCSTRYGYNHHPPSVAGGTPVGTYTLTINVSGNDGSAVTVHDIPLVLQVK